MLMSTNGFTGQQVTINADADLFYSSEVYRQSIEQEVIDMLREKQNAGQQLVKLRVGGEIAYLAVAKNPVTNEVYIDVISEEVEDD